MAITIPVDGRLVIPSTLNEDAKAKLPRVFNAAGEAVAKSAKDGTRYITEQVVLPWFTEAEMNNGIQGLSRGLARLAKEFAELKESVVDGGYTVKLPLADSSEVVERTYPGDYIPKNLAESVFANLDKGLTLTIQGKLNQSMSKRFLKENGESATRGSKAKDII